MSEPRTEAGKRLAASLTEGLEPDDTVLDAILVIQAEAAAPVDPGEAVVEADRFVHRGAWRRVFVHRGAWRHANWCSFERGEDGTCTCGLDDARRLLFTPVEAYLAALTPKEEAEAARYPDMDIAYEAGFEDGQKAGSPVDQVGGEGLRVAAQRIIRYWPHLYVGDIDLLRAALVNDEKEPGR